MGWFRNYAVQQTEALTHQLNKIKNSYTYSNADIAIMPDAHVGKGTCVGFTARARGCISPFAIGVDIGCAVSGIVLEDIKWNDSVAEKLQKVIENCIPSGNQIRSEEHPYVDLMFAKRELRHIPSWKHLEEHHERIKKSIGTLGGGNHFIEFGRSNLAYNRFMLTIHTGSRCFGNYVAQRYQKMAKEQMEAAGMEYFTTSFNEYKELYLKNHLYEKIAEKRTELLNNTRYFYPIDEMAYFDTDSDSFLDYFLDVNACCDYSNYNHYAIMHTILEEMGWEERYDYCNRIFTQHNFIERDNLTNAYWYIRKGAIHLHGPYPALIPMNMRDGVLVVYPVQDGNIQWNYSAPHGAGRTMSRTQAKQTLDLETFQKDMEGISSWSVKNSTLDEAPKVYHNSNNIIEAMMPTAEVKEIYRPLFNYKDS